MKTSGRSSIIEGFVHKWSLSCPATPYFIKFLLSLQFTRGQSVEKLFIREPLPCRLGKMQTADRE